MNILITGATGNIGIPLINELCRKTSDNKIYAGVRDIDKARIRFKDNACLEYREFDFENPRTFPEALHGIDLIFLLRPPHISNINRVFGPLLSSMKQLGIKKAVLLSVQGAESSDIIPHRKIEKLLIENGFEYIFVRPSYFMQNLTTTLLDDIKKYNKVVLPAKLAKFNWIDIDNISELCSLFLLDFEKYKNTANVVTGAANLDFECVVSKINQIAKSRISYQSVSPVRFVFFKMRQRIPFGMAIVMCMLHYLPRIQKEPEITDLYRKMTGKNPTTIEDFIGANKNIFNKYS